MDTCILHRKEFVIIKGDEGFIVVNTKKGFRNGHTHLKTFNSCISVIKLVQRKEIPKNKSKYFLKSILRINMDKEYAERIKDLMINYKDLMQEDRCIDERRCQGR
jgi:hypothetical protein